jgi:hypothetical protein
MRKLPLDKFIDLSLDIGGVCGLGYKLFNDDMELMPARCRGFA